MRTTSRQRSGSIALGLIVALGGVLSSAEVARAQAQDLRFEAAEQLYALSEALEGARPLWGELFKNGWPTDKRHRRLTLELFGAQADALMASYLGSGAGLPLSASSYQDRRAQAQKPSPTTGALLLRQQLVTYKQLSGATFNVASGFDPVVLPFQRARAELTRAHDPNDLASLRWKPAPSPRHALDALGFALLCEARYARQQLSLRRDAPGGKAKLWGETPEGGFFGLVAAHCAVAKLHEVRRLVVDVRSEEFSAKESLVGLEDFRYFVPSGWTTSARAGGPDHALLEGDDRLKSHLLGLSALLLGACEMLALSDPEGPSKELQAAFADRPPEGASAPLFEAGTFDVALDVALFAFRSMRAFHVNVIQGRATSLGGPVTRGSTVTPTDLGLFLMALEAFKTRVKISGRLADRHPRHAEVQDEQRKTETLLRSLAGASFRAWDADEPGFYDVYSISNNSRQAQTKSLAAQGLAVRGLLASHRHVAPGADTSPLLEAAERTLRWLDRERWDTEARAYTEKAGAAGAPVKALTFGAAATLGALRDMALTTRDGRYLARYTQYLDSLARGGLVRAPADRVAAGFAPEVVFGGAK